MISIKRDDLAMLYSLDADLNLLYAKKFNPYQYVLDLYYHQDILYMLIKNGAHYSVKHFSVDDSLYSLQSFEIKFRCISMHMINNSVCMQSADKNTIYFHDLKTFQIKSKDINVYKIDLFYKQYNVAHELIKDCKEKRIFSCFKDLICY